MTERPDASPWRNLVGSLLLSSALVLSPQVFAQEDSEEEETDEVEATEEITVTGSRIKRNTYSSISPLQIIGAQVSRNVGAIDPSTILQDSPAANGQQIDTTFQGFVLDNGPGASTVDLRGLGAQRTLVLVNGRRAAPAGVEGVPFAADLNIIPRALVQQYEILLDGASSVYGSDALSGVANIVLRKDFDGLQVESFTTVPQYDNGIQQTLSVAWGQNFDRGFIGFAGEVSNSEFVRRADRPWSSECETNREITTEGEIRTTNILYADQFGMKPTECVIAFGAQRTFDNNGLFGSIYWTPGETNTGIPNLSEASLFSVVVDTDDDGVPDVDFTDYFISNEDNASYLLPEQDTTSFMAYGEYTFDGDMNLTPYFETTYNKRETFARNLGASVFIEAPANNPFNPCNPNAIDGRGVDCGLAFDGLLNDPGYIDDFIDFYGVPPTAFPFIFVGETGALPLESQVSIRGDRAEVTSEVEQIRFVGGIKGDLPMIDFGSVRNWNFDVAYSYTESEGVSSRPGINERNLELALGWYSASETPCESNLAINPLTGEPVPNIDAATLSNCVPVDLFAPSLFENIIDNELATQAERDFLFDTRDFETIYEQSFITAIVSGDLFELPYGTVSAAFGYEYRNDRIDSIPNAVARDGQLFGFFRDLGAIGEKDTEEYFAELEVPILANVPGAKELNVNFSTRRTEDEFYPVNWTYSAKVGWRPIDNLLIRGTVGTSYRAPNLRENFLLGQSGFLNLSDPCVPPDDALEIGGVYNPDADTRNQIVIDNCIAQGVDPTSLGVLNNGSATQVYSVEILRGRGSTTLAEEQSESWTAGFSWDVEIFDGVDVLEDVGINLGATYYEIDIRDSIVQQGAQGSINACFNDPELDSVFCSNLDREQGGTGFINEVRQQFLNRDSLQTRGVDLNMTIDWPVTIFDRPVDLSADFNFNRKLQFSDAITDIVSGAVERDSDLDQFGLPTWEGTYTFRADYDKYRVVFNTRYLGGVQIDPDTRAALPFGDLTDGYRTCLGAARGDVDCRPIGEAENYFRSDLSFFYYGDVWTLGVGARNVFNEFPPLVDGTAQFSAFNVPFGAGYDINGRQYFVNVTAQFDNVKF